jgi:hypothetical protein
MSIFEAEALMSQYTKEYKNTWEQVRILAYHSIAPYSSHLKLKNVLRFKWDVDDEEKLSPQEFEMRKQAMIDLIQNTENFKEYGVQ